MSTDFSFLKDISSMNLYTMALFVTETDRHRFNRFCLKDFRDNNRDDVREIIENWHTLQNDNKICVLVDERLG